MKIITTLAAIAVFAVSSLANATPVNINTASASEIAEALNGIGLSKAQAIVDFRQNNGLFSSAEQIVSVRGIGESTFMKNKGDILVK
tara:strand:- start:149 stop:409 length:261 start_codon:yes stop_codon:yes gene_type:complete